MKTLEKMTIKQNLNTAKTKKVRIQPVTKSFISRFGKISKVKTNGIYINEGSYGGLQVAYGKIPHLLEIIKDFELELV